MTRLPVIVCLVALSVPAAARPTFAQANQQAQLRVTVVDQTGGGVPEALVRITRADGTSVDVSGGRSRRRHDSGAGCRPGPGAR